MTNKIDKRNRCDRVHVFLAIRRNKCNPGQTQKDELCFREVMPATFPVDTEIDFIQQEKTLKNLKARLEPGSWRIYKTVNTRDVNKTYKIFQIMMIEYGESWIYRIDHLWKKCLCKPDARAEKKFLLDIDSTSPDVLREVNNFLILNKIKHGFNQPTPNGYHKVTDAFNIKSWLDKPSCVTILNDGYIFIEEVTVK